MPAKRLFPTVLPERQAMDSNHQPGATPLTPEALHQVRSFGDELCKTLRALRSDPEFSAKNLRSAYQQGHKDALEQAEDATRLALESLLQQLADPA